MKIAIDARFYGTEHTGLGRYTTNVMRYLPQHLQDVTLKVLLSKKYFDTLKLPDNCEKVLADFDHYSLAEQFALPRLLKSMKADMFYSFHFNVPLWSPVPFVVTIHDLIKSHFSGSDTTTRSPWFFKLKRLGYNLTIKHAVNNSTRIIVPTNTVKNDILEMFNSDPTKIVAIPEAPDMAFRSSKSAKASKVKLPNKYLLFVGNAYPHKNLSVLLKAMKSLESYHLVIVTKRTPFLEKVLLGQDMARIHLLSDLTDLDLVEVYKQAAALVTPSLMEGYGLPGIEAMMVGTPVVASNIPVYREVYGDKAAYFDPNSSLDLVKAIKSLRTNSSRVLRFDRTWDDVASNIAEVISESCHSLRQIK